MTIGFKSFIIVFLVAGLFLVAIYSFATGVMTNYDKDTSLIEPDTIDLTQLEEQIGETGSQAQAWEKSFTSDNLFVSLGSIVLFSIWGIFKLMWSSVNALSSIYFEGAYNVLGLDPLITGTLTALLIISMIFAVWRVIKTGE